MIKLCIQKCLSDYYFFILNYQNSLSSSTSTRSNIESTSTRSGFIALNFLGESLGDAFEVGLKIIRFEGGGFKVGGYKIGFYLGAIYTLGFSGTKYLFTSFLFTLPTSLAQFLILLYNYNYFRFSARICNFTKLSCYIFVYGSTDSRGIFCGSASILL